MNCPSCGHTLSEKTQGNYVYFKCEECFGILAKGHVISEIVDSLDVPNTSINTNTLKVVGVSNIYSLRENFVSCPKCNEKMEKFNYAYDSNIFADKCPNCQYIWLSGGEVDKIASYLSFGSKGKRKSMSSEVLDLFRRGNSDDNLSVGEKPLPPFTIDALVIGDKMSHYKFPIVTSILITLNVVIYLVYLKNFHTLVPDLGMPDFLRILHGRGMDTSLLYVLFTNLLLWVFGDNVEDALGHLKYLLLYILSWVFTVAVFRVASGEMLPMVGSSFRLSAIMGSYLALYPKAQIKVLSLMRKAIYRIPAYSYLIFFAVHFLFLPFTYKDNLHFIYLSHVFGFFLGFAVMFVLKKTGLVRIIMNFSEFD